jgi:hypothetical protein
MAAVTASLHHTTTVPMATLAVTRRRVGGKVVNGRHSQIIALFHRNAVMAVRHRLDETGVVVVFGLRDADFPAVEEENHGMAASMQMAAF